MLRISLDVISHDFHVDESFNPFKKEKIKLESERSTAVNDEVERFLNNGSVLEVKYSDWLKMR